MNRPVGATGGTGQYPRQVILPARIYGMDISVLVRSAGRLDDLSTEVAPPDQRRLRITLL